MNVVLTYIVTSAAPGTGAAGEATTPAAERRGRGPYLAAKAKAALLAERACLAEAEESLARAMAERLDPDAAASERDALVERLVAKAASCARAAQGHRALAREFLRRAAQEVAHG